jgi:hypothetical protein
MVIWFDQAHFWWCGFTSHVYMTCPYVSSYVTNNKHYDDDDDDDDDCWTGWTVYTTLF